MLGQAIPATSGCSAARQKFFDCLLQLPSITSGTCNFAFVNRFCVFTKGSASLRRKDPRFNFESICILECLHDIACHFIFSIVQGGFAPQIGAIQPGENRRLRRPPGQLAPPPSVYFPTSADPMQ
jgi:hypothetical protein